MRSQTARCSSNALAAARRRRPCVLPRWNSWRSATVQRRAFTITGCEDGGAAALVLLEAAYRAMQRGITRPARETLFTVVAREDKYKAKSAIDTFVYRTGDLTGAWTEGLLGRLGGGVTALTALVVPTAVAWAVLSVWLARQQGRIAASVTSADGAGSHPHTKVDR